MFYAVTILLVGASLLSLYLLKRRVVRRRQETVWRFPSGATLSFGPCDEGERYKSAGHEIFYCD